MIWKQEITIEELNKRGEGTLSSFLGITFTEVSENSLTATMVVKKEHLQPVAIMHGGMNCVLAETVGSAAGNYCVPHGHIAVGLDINTNHIGAAKEGETIVAIARPHHLGKSTQVWEIITEISGKKSSISRLTLFIR